MLISVVERVMVRVGNLLSPSSTDRMHFHNYFHAANVVKWVGILCDESGVDQHYEQLLKIAAWCHDLGIIIDYQNHENESISISRNILSEEGVSEEDIKFIVSCINATRMPQKPNNCYEEILCDADLAHLGSPDYLSWSKKLRLEWEQVLGLKFTDCEWVKLNIEFFAQHSYHSKVGQRHLENQKIENQKKLLNLVTFDC